MKNLKLNVLEAQNLNNKEMNALRGGSCCCGCNYANRGGSSTGDNNSANTAGGLSSPGCNKVEFTKNVTDTTYTVPGQSSGGYTK